MAMPSEFSEDEIVVAINKFKAADVDKKVDQLQYLGLRLEFVSSIPESTLDALILLTAPLLRSTNHLLLFSVLSSFLPFFIPLLPASSARHITLALVQLLPGLAERLNDAKERTHAPARACVVALGRKAHEADAAALQGSATSVPSASASAGPGKGAKDKDKDCMTAQWERAMRDVMLAKGARGKVEAMGAVRDMRAAGKGSLKPWLGVMVEILEDGDALVRETARETLVALLSPPTVPAAARTELKKLLVAHSVRKSIADPILARILGGGAGPAPADIPLPPDEVTPGAAVSEPAGGKTSASAQADDVAVVYIASARDLEAEFAKMLPHFEGKETEHNWQPREKSVIRLRGMLRGQAHKEFAEAFSAGMKGGVFDGVSRTIISLRTTLSQQSCALIQELVEGMGSSFDPFVEGILPTLAKMAGYTKKLIAERSQRVVSAIIIHTTSAARIYIAHLVAGVSDKNVGARHFAAGHIKTFVDIHGARARSAIDSAGLAEPLEGAVRKSLADVNPQVRELARAAFWAFNGIWTQRGKAVMESLDPQARKQLDKAQMAHLASASVPGSAPSTRPPSVASAPAAAPPPPSVAAPAVPAARPAPTKRAQTSTMALIQEKRRQAKAAELAKRAVENSPRIVSGPVPSSPALGQGMPRSTSSQSIATPTRRSGLIRTTTSPDASPTASRSAALPAAKLGNGGSTTKPMAVPLSNRSRSSSLARTASHSPPSADLATPGRSTPLRTSNLRSDASAAARSPTGSTATSSHTLKTPVMQQRKHLPDVARDTIGLGVFGPGPGSSGLLPGDGSPARGGMGSGRRSGASQRTPSQMVVEDAIRAQAEQAMSAAEQLLDFEDGEADATTPPPPAPVTPARLLPGQRANGRGNGHSQDLLRTPVNAMGSAAVWEDSPRNQAVTPTYMEKLKGRRYEQKWWTRQKKLIGEASPLKQDGSAGSALAIAPDVAALENGEAGVRNLQRIALFAASQPVSVEGELGETEEDVAERVRARAVWEEDKLFARVWEGLMRVLRPENSVEVLEQALVLLWEMVQHQWPLFEDREEDLVVALFKLRSSTKHTIIESTNSLLSLLTTATDRVILLGTLRSGLASFVASIDSAPAPASASPAILPRTAALASASLFALNGIGMCILHLPPAVVLAEAGALEPLIMTSLASETVTTRHAANIVLLAIQCVLGPGDADGAAAALQLFPRLNAAQRSLALYLMQTNGLLGADKGEMGEGEGRRSRVMDEMEGLMARGVVGPA